MQKIETKAVFIREDRLTDLLDHSEFIDCYSDIDILWSLGLEMSAITYFNSLNHNIAGYLLNYQPNADTWDNLATYGLTPLEYYPEELIGFILGEELDTI